LKAYSLQRKI